MSDRELVGLSFRDWQLERECDQQFARVVPPVKWDYFAKRLRPLTDDLAATLREQLFAGVVHPFNFKLAVGWMGKIFRTVRAVPDYRGLTADKALAEAFGAADLGPVFAVYHFIGDPVYAAEWPVMLDCLMRGWLVAPDSFVMCAEGTSTIALFWEGHGPYFGKRGNRRLI
jgi:uncharacterized membrane protein YGL010W